MAGHAVEHDYHIIPPSPWPFLSGLAALVWGLGMVVFFAGRVMAQFPEGGLFYSSGLFLRRLSCIVGGAMSRANLRRVITRQLLISACATA